MEFKVVLAQAKEKGVKFKFKGETVAVADWAKDELSPNRLDNEIDSFFDGFGDIVKDENGQYYMASKLYTSEHFGEYGIWCQIELDENSIEL